MTEFPGPSCFSAFLTASPSLPPLITTTRDRSPYRPARFIWNLQPCFIHHGPSTHAARIAARFRASRSEARGGLVGVTPVIGCFAGAVPKSVGSPAEIANWIGEGIVFGMSF